MRPYVIKVQYYTTFPTLEKEQIYIIRLTHVEFNKVSCLKKDIKRSCRITFMYRRLLLWIGYNEYHPETTQSDCRRPIYFTIFPHVVSIAVMFLQPYCEYALL